MVESASVQFGELARCVAGSARSLGLRAPVFRSPPRVVGVTRTLRYRDDGQAVVAVAFRNRPTAAVVADLIEAVIVTNDLAPAQAARHRDDLWAALSDSVSLAA